MYQFESRVRYSETGKDGKLTLESILNYFQDCTNFHSLDIGYGLDYMLEGKTTWILLSWQIVVEKYPKMGESIKVGTKAYDFRRSFGYRNFMMYDDKGEFIAYANSVWLCVDKETMKPVRVDKEQIDAYCLEERLPMEYESMHIVLPKEGGTKKEPITVQNYHLDTNEHVNNGQYLRMAYLVVGSESGLEIEGKVKQMRAEYKKAALLGDMIFPVVFKEQEKVVVALNNEEGKPYAVIELLLGV